MQTLDATFSSDDTHRLELLLSLLGRYSLPSALKSFLRLIRSPALYPYNQEEFESHDRPHCFEGSLSQQVVVLDFMKYGSNSHTQDAYGVFGDEPDLSGVYTCMADCKGSKVWL